MEQLAIDFKQEKAFVCGHRHYDSGIAHVWCDLHEVWTNCGLPLCGEVVGCAYDEPDNSLEARARRVAWLKAHN